MNWFTFSLIAGIVFVLAGIGLLFTGENVASIVCFAIGAGFFGLDFRPTEAGKSEFSGLPKDLFIKKILGVVVLIAALVLFSVEIIRLF